jgi:thiazole synthase
MLGSARYPSIEVLRESIVNSGTEIVTVGLRRQSPENAGGQVIWDMLQALEVRLLPNTAGCHSAREAINLARMAREILQTNWIKLEVIEDDYSLTPNPTELVEAARALCTEGFEVFPYCTEDIGLSEELLNAGCALLMPWAAPIGTGRGILKRTALEHLRDTFPEIPLIIDAGLGAPAHVATAMEMGFDAVLLNTAVARATNPAMMACAMRAAVMAGRMGYEAGIMPAHEQAEQSTPSVGQPFWHHTEYRTNSD